MPRIISIVIFSKHFTIILVFYNQTLFTPILSVAFAILQNSCFALFSLKVIMSHKWILFSFQKQIQKSTQSLFHNYFPLSTTSISTFPCCSDPPCPWT